MIISIIIAEQYFVCFVLYKKMLIHVLYQPPTSTHYPQPVPTVLAILEDRDDRGRCWSIKSAAEVGGDDALM